MNVLYDISQLGHSHKSADSKTGIARVVETLGQKLAVSEECSLTFCATQHLTDARAYAVAQPDFINVPFPHERYKDYVSCNFHQVDAFMRARGGSGLLMRPLRKLLYTVESRVGNTALPVDARALAQADVFHSPFQALHNQVKQSKVAKFLTVYDLTPILFPEYFVTLETNRPVNIDGFKSIIQSLGPEDHALCISEATKADLCEYTQHDPKRAIVTYLAADANLFYQCKDKLKIAQSCEKYQLPHGSYLLSLSTLEPRKNIEHVIRCFVQLVQEQKIDDLSLVLAGAKGWNYERIFTELDAAQNIKDRIIVTGRVEDEHLAALYSGALAFVYMSHYEGFGLPPLEAMQCGVPVITSNTSSLPEVVGDAGIMLAPTDTDGLCQALLQVYQDRNLRDEMAQKSLKRAGQFSWERCAQETIAAYKTALARA